jgi:hypothetical protein
LAHIRAAISPGRERESAAIRLERAGKPVHQSDMARDDRHIGAVARNTRDVSGL